MSNRILVREDHPLQDPAHRVLQENRRRANIALQEESQRERNRGQEKLKKYNNVPENQASKAFLAMTQGCDPQFPVPCSSGLSSVSSWSPQEGLSPGTFGNSGGVEAGEGYLWVLQRPWGTAVITRSHCLPPLAPPHHQSILTDGTMWIRDLALLCSMGPHESSFRTIHFVHVAGTKGCL